jgi:hypothetical protein
MIERDVTGHLAVLAGRLTKADTYGGQTAQKKIPKKSIHFSQNIELAKLKQNISFKLDSNVLNVAGVWRSGALAHAFNVVQ